MGVGQVLLVLARPGGANEGRSIHCLDFRSARLLLVGLGSSNASARSLYLGKDKLWLNNPGNSPVRQDHLANHLNPFPPWQDLVRVPVRLGIG